MPEKNYFFVFIKFIDARKQYTLIGVHVSSITPTIKEYYENAVRFLRILVSQPKFLDTNQVIEMVFKISLWTIFLPGRRWTIARPRSNVLQLGPRPSCKSRPTNITCDFLWEGFDKKHFARKAVEMSCGVQKRTNLGPTNALKKTLFIWL